MGIFNRKNSKYEPKTGATAADAPKIKKATALKSEKVEKAETVGAAAVKADRSSFVLLSPRVSEKAAMLTSKGTYVFNVPVSAEKIEIRKAIEALYKVKIERVNTARGIGKVVRRGRIAGRRNNWKKAIVTLKAGQTIDLYKGV